MRSAGSSAVEAVGDASQTRDCCVPLVWFTVSGPALLSPTPHYKGSRGIDRSLPRSSLQPTTSLNTYLSRFFRVLTSRLRPSLASVASSSSLWSLRRDALARVASSSASSSWRLSCFILALAFSILGRYMNKRQTVNLPGGSAWLCVTSCDVTHLHLAKPVFTEQATLRNFLYKKQPSFLPPHVTDGLCTRRALMEHGRSQAQPPGRVQHLLLNPPMALLLLVSAPWVQLRVWAKGNGPLWCSFTQYARRDGVAGVCVGGGGGDRLQARGKGWS